ncbi:MAG: hypothetical protein HC875_41010 [Anaerolineales bacterium]|nr:hypothetical protein [Anaerolineales bacterium]
MVRDRPLDQTGQVRCRDHPGRLDRGIQVQAGGSPAGRGRPAGVGGEGMRAGAVEMGGGGASGRRLSGWLTGTASVKGVSEATGGRLKAAAPAPDGVTLGRAASGSRVGVGVRVRRGVEVARGASRRNRGRSSAGWVSRKRRMSRKRRITNTLPGIY